MAKCTLFVLVITGIVYRVDLWAWVSSMSVSERSDFAAGFLLKWIVLALLFYGAATLPHYVKPYLELFRRRGIAKVKNYRKAQAPVRPPRTNPRENFATQLLTRMLFKQNPPIQRSRQNNPQDEIRLKW